MMRFGRALVALMALMMLPLGAWAQDRPMGRYVEVALTDPDPEGASFCRGEGVMYAVNQAGDTLYTSADLINWTSGPTGHDEQLAPTGGHVNRLAVAGGAVYLASGSGMRDEEGRDYVERIAGGASQRITLDRALSWNTDGIELCALDSGELVALSSEAAYRFAADGTTIARYPVNEGDALAVSGDEIAVCSWRDGVITVYSLSAKQIARTIELPTASYGAMGYDGEGALYYACQDGLYRVNAGGTLMVQLVDGRLTTLGSPNALIMALVFDRNNDPVVSIRDRQSGAMSLVGYRYDDSVDTEPSQVLSVYALYETETLKENAALFQKAYPGVLVDIAIGLTQDSAVTRDDAIRALNTAILAGKGPDVLVLDGLPMAGYLQKDMLSDLSGLVKPMIDQGQLLANLAGAYDQGGVIPAVPTRVLMPTLWGDVSGMKTLDDMAAYAASHPESMPYYAVENESLIGTFYVSCAPYWFDGAGKLDRDRVAAFFTALKAIRGPWHYDYFVDKTGLAIRSYMEQMGVTLPGWDPYAPLLMGETMEEMYGRDFLAEGRQRQLPFLLRGPDATTFPSGALNHVGAGDVIALPGQCEGCFVPALTMGVVKQSPRQDMAMDFIRIALEAELQSSDMMEGFPVNVQALDRAQAREDAVFGTSSNGLYETAWPDEAMRAQLRGLIEALHTPVSPDFTLFDMMVAESALFFEGAMDAGQAADNLCAKANAYLSE